jgi:hypothetical protein
VFFLVISALAGSTFIYCSFWASKFIDLDRTVQHLEEWVVTICPSLRISRLIRCSRSFDIPTTGSIALSPRFASTSKSKDTIDHGRR